MNLRFRWLSPILALMLLFGYSGDLHAQKGKKKKKDDTEAAASDKKEKDSFGEIVKKSTASEGLFTLYRDTADGSTYLSIDPEQLDKEYIYFSHIADGVLDAGFFRGNYRGSKIIVFKKNYNRVEVLAENTKYYFDENNALSRSSKANINIPVLASLEIKATDKKTGKILVSGDDIFKSEDFQMIKRPDPKGGEPGMLGKLSKEKTKVSHIRNYPENTDVLVDYVYDNPTPRNFGSSAVTDARNITVKYQHSILAVPENGFEPRRDDARIGYFMTSVNDMTSLEVTPYRDMIHRWNLVKKDPSASISEPVEPITFWIENTTPLEFRDIIKESGERWNQAFEKAGFKNALVIKVQPDTATWDAGDIRYNVLRWTSSPRAPFGGYGPSFVNPKTGQILGADIMLEFSAVARRLFRKEVFAKAGYMDAEDWEKADMDDDPHLCSMGHVMNHNLNFGLSAMNIDNLTDAAKEQFVRETLGRLILHEIGHTLGLTHNMRASTLLSMEELKNPETVKEKGLCNSVMEYPAINYPASLEELSKYYDDKPGPYDLWVIEYGYSPALPDANAEKNRLESILSRSTAHELAYGNDGDDMRSPGKGIDPDINIYDLSDDPVAYGSERVELVKRLMGELIEDYGTKGASYEELLQAYLILTGEYANQVSVFTRQIGGVHINRAVVGQPGKEGTPFTPVSAERQKAAMKALEKYAFAPDAFASDENVYRHLQPQRRGFNQPGSGEDPKIHARILSIQKNCLRHLLNTNVLERITDTELYGNEYTLDLYLTDLTDAIFKADISGTVAPMRQNLQIEYTQGLVKIIASPGYDNVSKSMALYELNRIDSMAKNASAGDILTKAHRAHLRQIVKDALEA